MRIQSKYLDEKLTSADPTSKWVSDFVHSDNPKFAGKSKKERIKMALGAAYAAKGQSRNEETYKDTGWKSPERKPGAKTKNVSGKLARQGMKQAEKEAKKVQEEVKDLAELSKETLTKYATRTRFSSDPKHREGSMKAMEKAKKKEEKVEEENKAYRAQDAESKRTTGMSLDQRSKMYDDIQKKLKDQEEEYRKQGILPAKSTNEAISSDKKDELRGELGHEDHLPHTVHINGKPWKKFEGYNAGPRAKKATDTLNAKGKNATYGISEEVDESIGSAIGGAIGQYTGSKIGMDGPGRAHGELAGRAIEYHVRKFAKKIKDKFTKKANEEVEQVDEVLDSAGKFMSYTTKAAASGLKSAVMGTGKFRKRQAGIQRAVDKTKAKINNEEVEIEEAEQLDELSPGTLGNYIKKATHSAKIAKQKADDAEKDRARDEYNKQKTKYWKRKEGILKAVDSLTKEEIELEEDGKLKGGAKDPCWKGYQMVGTKKKGGRTVPNCVPREETELKTFKALREELNGNSNRS